MYNRRSTALFMILFLFWMQGCSNIEIGFEEGSPFYKQKANPYANERVLCVYLDPLLEKKEYHLAIDAEDTEIKLQAGAITCFGIYKKQVDIVLLDGEKEIAALRLALAQKKEYALRIFLNNEGKVKMQPLSSSLLPKKAPRSGLYVSQKIEKKKTPPVDTSAKQSKKEAHEEETTLVYELDDGE